MNNLTEIESLVMRLARIQLDCVSSLHPCGYLLARDDNDCVIKLKEFLAGDDEIPELEELEKELLLHHDFRKAKIIRNIFLIRQVNLKVSRYITDQNFYSSTMAPLMPIPLKDINDKIAEGLKNLKVDGKNIDYYNLSHTC